MAKKEYRVNVYADEFMEEVIAQTPQPEPRLLGWPELHLREYWQTQRADQIKRR